MLIRTRPTSAKATGAKPEPGDIADRQISPTPLYSRIMGQSWTRVASSIRDAHGRPVLRGHGRLRIEHGRHIIARLLVRALQLPDAAPAADTQLLVTAKVDGELWQRTFNGRAVATWQYESGGSQLAERFGILEFRFHLDPMGDGLRYRQSEVALVIGPIRVRLPGLCAPTVDAWERPDGPRRIALGVGIALPGIGRVIGYDGVIEIEDPPA